MEIVIHGTKGGYKILYQTLNAPFSLARDMRRIDRNDGNTVGQTAYSIAFVDGGCAFTKYVVVRDTERAAIGNIAFSVYIPSNQKMAGCDIRMLLDELAEKYCRNYVIDGDLGNKQEDWTFAATLAERYEKKLCHVKEENIENYQQGIGEAAYIYYSGNVEKYFDYPYQRDYSSYVQIFFVDQRYEYALQNPLNSLRHDSDANLTGRIVPVNRRKVPMEPSWDEKRLTTIEMPGETDKILEENDIETNKRSKTDHIAVSNRGGARGLKKIGILGGIVLAIVVIIVVIVLNREETTKSVLKSYLAAQVNSVIDVETNIDSLYHYLIDWRDQEPQIKEEKGFLGLGKTQKDSVEYKEWKELEQKLEEKMVLEIKSYLSGTELYKDKLEAYKKLTTNADVLRAIEKCIEFRKLLDEYEFTKLIKDFEFSYSDSQKTFEEALRALEETIDADGRNDRQRAVQRLGNDKEKMKKMNLNTIAKIMREVHEQKGNRKETNLKYCKSQEKLSNLDEDIRKKIQGYVEKGELEGLLKKVTSQCLKSSIQLYLKFWNCTKSSTYTYESLLSELKNDDYLKDSKLKEAVETLKNSKDYGESGKKIALNELE